MYAHEHENGSCHDQNACERISTLERELIFILRWF